MNLEAHDVNMQRYRKARHNQRALDNARAELRFIRWCAVGVSILAALTTLGWVSMFRWAAAGYEQHINRNGGTFLMTSGLIVVTIVVIAAATVCGAMLYDAASTVRAKAADYEDSLDELGGTA